MDVRLTFSVFLCIFFQHCINVEMKNFQFANSYGNHMVLQMAPAQARIWGYGKDGSAGSEVAVEVAGKRYTTRMQAGTRNGPIWQIDLDPISTPGPYKITATNAGQSIQLTDVLFGDVWFCSGQSNMVHFLSRIFNPQEEIDDVMNYPDIRTYMVGRAASGVPQEDIKSVRQQWAKPNKEKMKTYSAVCWLFGKYLNQRLKRPIGLIQSSVGGTAIQAWMSTEALSGCAAPHQSSAGLWNGMVHPLLQMNIKGLLWYQGESNAFHPSQYSAYEGCLQSMVSDYRKKFNRRGQEANPLPWGIVQLAPFRNNHQKTSGYTDVRWAQSFSHGYLPNPKMQDAFLAVAIDLPDFFSPYGSIHPRFKRKISERLALGALSVVYGQKGRFQGPFPSAFKRGDTSLHVTYDDGNVQLVSRNRTGFELCCSKSPTITCEKTSSNAAWTATTISRVVGSTAAVTVTCAAGQYVTGIRYAWRESPCELEKCALYSQDFEIPAPPYIKHGLLN